MEIRLLEVAQQELDEAVEYYNAESVGLGNHFLLEALATLKRVRQFPTAWRPYTEHTRRCQLRRFPYAIVYQILDSEILIVAISHMHRLAYILARPNQHNQIECIANSWPAPANGRDNAGTRYHVHKNFSELQTAISSRADLNELFRGWRRNRRASRYHVFPRAFLLIQTFPCP
ncbi:MAG: hypothetical protein QOJ64_3370 [Acidobacteriota bacterium]|jgi:plasmid stabilization system protein ParE|nr:hypothetical protein [Acidobacteriota bacterium]